MRGFLRSSFSFLLCLMVAHNAVAAGFLRDAEIEDTLHLMTDPILAAADIEPASVRLFMINDDSINAFVAGGQNIFFHTGLLLKVDNPSMLMGVIAHETGHISGAHLTQLASATDDAALGALLSTILGAVAVLGGSPQAGSAIISGGQNASMRNLLSHYRGNEQQADQAGIKYMRAIGLSPAGMLDMFELLRRNERQHIGPGGNAYLRTHPLTTDRIAALRGQVDAHSDLPKQPDADLLRRFARMQAKLFAFLSPSSETLRRYPQTDHSEAAYLARAVAYFRLPDIDKALTEVNTLLSLAPDAYGYDLKGQILFEHGRIDEAIAAYKQAEELADNNGLIMTDLGKAYLAKPNDQYLNQAVAVLERASRLTDAMASTHRNLAVAYGKQGKLGESYLSLAREAALQNEPQTIIRYATEAKDRLQGNPILQLQADDLIADAKRVKEKDK